MADLTSSDLDALAAQVKARLSTITPGLNRKALTPEVDGDGYEEAAAVLTTFGETDLSPVGVHGGDSDAERQASIDSLLEQSVRTRNPFGEWRWTLRTDSRVATLRHLRERGAIEAAITANPVVSPDFAQDLLTRMLRGDKPEIEPLTAQQLRAVQQVSAWLSAAGFPNTPDPNLLASRMAWRTLLQPFEHLVGEHYRGRQEEIAKLRSFVGIAPPQSFLEAASRHLQTFREAVFKSTPNFGFMLTGPGGVGKSTLVAKFILEHAEAHASDRFPFAYLDFDRPDVDKLEPLSVLAEAVRQFGVSYPELADRLEELRLSWLARLPRAKTPKDLSEIRSAAAHEAARILEEANGTKRPVLLVLDTFEEVQYCGQSAVDTLFQLLDRLRERVDALRIVIVGRAEVEGRAVVRLELGAFDQSAAIGYLAARGISDESLAKSIYDRFGGSPLTLRLAADLVRSEAGVEELRSVKGNTFLTRLEDGVIQRQLYTRILAHIHDERVRKLAHPGLVLRRLTPEIIKDVLAEPCGLGTLELEAAGELFEAFGREVALVKLDPDGALRHRPDLRQLMGALLRTDKPDLAKNIEKRAVSFYENCSTDVERAEEIYHRLWLNEPREIIERRWRPSLMKTLYSAIEEFDPPRRAFLAMLFEIDPDAEALDAADLPLWERLISQKIQPLIRSGKFSEAFRLVRTRAERTSDSPLVSQEAWLLVQLGQQEEALYLLNKGVRRALDAGSVRSAVKLSVNFAEFVVRLGRRDLAEMALALLSEIQKRPETEDDRIFLLALRGFLIQLAAPEKAPSKLYPPIGVSADFNKLTDRTARWFAAAPGVDSHERVVETINAFGLPKCSDAAKRVLALALANCDEDLSKKSGRPPGAFARRFDVAVRKTLIESWSAFVLDTSPRRVAEVVLAALRSTGEPQLGALVEAVQLVMSDSLNLVSTAVEEREKPVRGGDAPKRRSSVPRSALTETISKSFSREEFDAILSSRLDVQRAAYVSGDAPFSKVVEVIVDAANTEGWISRLLSDLASARPNNPELSRLALEFSEASAGSPSMELGPFSNKLVRLTNWICRVESADGHGLGTGALIGPDIVLTADSVIPESGRLGIRFDFFSDHKISEGVSFGAELYGRFAVSENEFPHPKFALIEVLGAPGAQPVGGLEGLESAAELRGWLELKRAGEPAKIGQPIAILQHPSGGPMKLSFGEVQSIHPLRHTAATIGGSAGALILDEKTFEPIGLHLGSGVNAEENLGFGFGIEIEQIVDTLESHNLARLVNRRFQ